ncbi:chromate transporter [Saccharibacillus alkalitolerans]|uniref:Chromate transporter n=1 Tax=Saccharibacillus alkalitolerans TaxID=2705290 RepID=A0ABX0EZZ2_9BACL|nr:chromate transporter [Saccharibacillus alkalitolerans]NGZ73787.1 chromate transporter [Saccharibacillus alkalitolerans]
MLWELFVLFFKVGCIAFGGGYAVMSMIQREVENKGWVGVEQFQEIGSLSGMAPGSIATNSATLIGYGQAGIPGALVATVGIVLPSLLLIMLLAAFFIKLQHRLGVRSAFYGLRPIVTALIVYAAINFGFGHHSKIGELLNWQTFGTLLICGGCLFAIVKYKWHPFAVILASAAAGIVIF